LWRTVTRAARQASFERLSSSGRSITLVWMHAGAVLARRLETAEAESAAAYAAVQPGSALERCCGGCAVFVGVGSPLTQAIGIGMNGAVAAQELDRLEEFFRSRGTPPVIDLCPLADPSLIEAISARGYRLTEFNTRLVRETGEPLPAVPFAVSVREAGPADESAWVRVLAQGFLERDNVNDDERHVGEILFRMRTSRCYLASVAGELAGAAAMSIQDGVGLLFADATRVAWRGRGAHQALIAARLQRAQAEGCEWVTASTLPGSGSQRNYERLGFRVIYTKVQVTR
jgi:GNAT superfamily N-acetyltransferase